LVRVVFGWFVNPSLVSPHTAKSPENTEDEAGGNYKPEHYEDSKLDMIVADLFFISHYYIIVRVVYFFGDTDRHEIGQPNRILDGFTNHYC
jgi:hypothetical protein